MRKNRLALIFTFSIALFIVSFVLGYQLVGNKLKTQDLSDGKKISQGEEGIEIIREENKITPNTFIEERTHYKECDHLITKLNIADDEVVNMTKKEYENHLKLNYPNIQLISYANTKIVIWGERNHLCQEHFIIGEENGYIAIFKIGEDGGRILYKTFEDYPLNILIEADQDKIREGIVVDSEDELSDVLENFIS